MYSPIMPAFQWLKINAKINANASISAGMNMSRGMNVSASPEPGFRSSYTDRHMIFLGGIDVCAGQRVCDNRNSSLKMLDLTTFEWQTQFLLADPIYRAPQPVIDVVGGGPNGGARPASWWQ